MSKKKKAKAKAAKKICIHCIIVEMLLDHFPSGMNVHNANHVLMSLAECAGEILSQADPAATDGFVEVLRRFTQKSPKHLLVVHGQVTH